MIRRISAYRAVFDEDDPLVFILAPSPERMVPAGDMRRGTAWLFRSRELAVKFSEWLRDRHQLETVPLQVRMRELAASRDPRDVTWVLDPQPQAGFGNPLSFKAPLPQ